MYYHSTSCPYPEGCNCKIPEFRYLEAENKRLKDTLKYILNYLQENLEVCDSPNSRRTIEIHIRVVEKELGIENPSNT